MDSSIYSYIFICLILVISPGPNTFLVFSTASNIGKSDTLLKILGLLSATYIHGLLSLFGISLLILRSEKLFFSVKIIGALYLLYLGIKFIKQAYKIKKDTNLDIRKVEKLSNFENFKEGFLTQLLNPKVSMFYIAAFPQFINFSNKYYHIQGLVLITIHALTIASWFLLMTFFIRGFSSFTQSQKGSKTIMYVSGSFLIYFSILLAIQPLPTLH